MLIKISVGSSFAAIFLIVFLNWLYFGLKKCKLMILREKFFKQNGGILLQQRISGDGGANDQAKVFTIEELKRETNNYHDNMIIVAWLLACCSYRHPILRTFISLPLTLTSQLFSNNREDVEICKNLLRNNGELGLFAGNRERKNYDHNEIIKVSTLATRCLHVQGDERPTMKEVAMELEGILASLIQKHPWLQSTSNEEEVEYLLKGTTDDYECIEGATGSSSTFDSMSKLTILPIASGR
uniref:Uncharacterized protein n=1 Tax=Lactuca sativa TaxID=4236 RepID=A0A9R1WPX9_LACSA|nr:hypothetical protein LSAT_V11C100041890 [Lactuca sativa]